jgi:hypothetical protein
VPEWGVWKNGEPNPDNPVYIADMFRWFQANAADVAYENYYNKKSLHELYPGTEFPKARAKYSRLW